MSVNNSQFIGKVGAILRPFLVDKEALRLSAYKDAKGLPTIGVGITSYSFAPTVAKRFGRNDVRIGDTITKQESDALFDGAMSFFTKGIIPLVKVQLNANQLAAISSLAYNWGLGNFKNSQLLKAINAGKPAAEISKIFEATALTSGGKKLAGLVTRRDKEEDLFWTPAKAGLTIFAFVILAALFFTFKN